MVTTNVTAVVSATGVRIRAAHADLGSVIPAFSTCAYAFLVEGEKSVVMPSITGVPSGVHAGSPPT